MLIGASLPFLGGLFGYIQQQELADSQQRQAQTTRNQQEATAVFTDIAKRLSSIRLIEDQIERAEEFKPDSVSSDSLLAAKGSEFAGAVDEWTRDYPRTRAVAETYFGKQLGEYLDIVDDGLRQRIDQYADVVRTELDARKKHLISDRLDRQLDSIRARITPAMVAATPPSARALLAEKLAKVDSQRTQLGALTARGLQQRDTTRKLLAVQRAQDTHLFQQMSEEIRDGDVGLPQEERDRMLARNTVLGELGIYPLDPETLFILFGIITIAVLVAYRLALLTGREPILWCIAAALATAPVLLFLLLAAPRNAKTTPEEVMGSQ